MSINSLSFASKIKFVDNQTFKKLPLQECLDQGNYVCRKKWTEKGIIKGEQGYTDLILNCSAGGITDGSHVTMFHLNPSKFQLVPNDDKESVHKFSNVEDELKKKIELNNRDSDEFNGLIIGGKYDHRNDCDYSLKTRILFENLKDFYEKNKINHSIFWGQGFGKEMTKIYYSGKGEDDTWIINTNTRIRNLNDLKKTFKEIFVSKKDELYINEQEIPREELKALNLCA